MTQNIRSSSPQDFTRHRSPPRFFSTVILIVRSPSPCSDKKTPIHIFFNPADKGAPIDFDNFKPSQPSEPKEEDPSVDVLVLRQAIRSIKEKPRSDRPGDAAKDTHRRYRLHNTDSVPTQRDTKYQKCGTGIKLGSFFFKQHTRQSSHLRYRAHLPPGWTVISKRLISNNTAQEQLNPTTLIRNSSIR